MRCAWIVLYGVSYLECLRVLALLRHHLALVPELLHSDRELGVVLHQLLHLLCVSYNDTQNE